MKQDLVIHPDKMNRLSLFPGIDMEFLSLSGSELSVCHKEFEHIMVINYCKSGRIGIRLSNGDYVYLGEGDFSAYTMKMCASSEIVLPSGSFEGISIHVNLRELASNPPELLLEAKLNNTPMYEKIYKPDSFVSFTGNERTENIFRFFYDSPEGMQTAYRRLKTLELLLYIFGGESVSSRCATGYQAEQIETVKKIHDRLFQRLDKRVTIEELSKQYLMNPTTMKELFKSVYGMSIAAHMKEHRMREAARLLLDTEGSIAEIASSVGYDSQSKFSSAFKEFFGILPTEYRKLHRNKM